MRVRRGSAGNYKVRTLTIFAMVGVLVVVVARTTIPSGQNAWSSRFAPFFQKLGIGGQAPTQSEGQVKGVSDESEVGQPSPSPSGSVLGETLEKQQLIFRITTRFRELMTATAIEAESITTKLLTLQSLVADEITSKDITSDTLVSKTITADSLVGTTAELQDLAVSGETALAGTLGVEGASTLTGPVTLGNTLQLGGDVTGEGVTIDVGDGEVLAGNLVYSLQGEVGVLELVEGDGITIDGLTISNDDPGTEQNIFKTIAVTGQSDVEADENLDTLTFAAGVGLTITTDASSDTLTISASGSDLNVSGWEDLGTNVVLQASSDNVGIGTTAPTEKLHVVGDMLLDGDLSVTGNTTVLSGFNNSGGGITNAGAITGATGFTSSGTITLSGLSTGVVQSNFNGILSSSALNLAGGSSYITGTLPIANGGTAITSYTAGDILYATDANTLTKLGIGGDGEVLTVAGGVPDWATASGSGPCATCLVNNPGSTQTITPSLATATGLSVRQASAGSVDIFNVTNSDGTIKYLRVDSSGNVQLGTNGATTTGNFTVSPSSTDPISIAPVAMGSAAYTGTITSEDLTAARTWTFPDSTGVVCLTTGNCSGTSASIGGSGTNNYVAKWNGTYSLANSLLYDNGTNVGIGTTVTSAKLHVAGSGYFTGDLTADGGTVLNGTLDVGDAASFTSTLGVDGTADFNSTLGVAGATTLSSTLNVTGLTTLSGNLNVNGTGNSYVMGNFGVGTATPTSIVEVTKAQDAATQLTVRNTNSTGAARSTVSVLADAAVGANLYALSSGYTTSGLLQASRTVLDGNGSTGLFVGASHASGYLGLYTGGLAANNERVRIDANGNVGIGTSTPGYKLDVNGSANFSNHINIAAGYGIISGDESFRVNGSQNVLTMLTSNNERMRIDSAGNVGIGTTDPGALLDVKFANNELKFGGNSLEVTTDNSSSPALKITGTGTADLLNIFDSATEVFTILDGGNVGVGATSPWAKLAVVGTSANPGDQGIFQVTTGTGGQLDEKVHIGVNDAGYSWIQAVKPGTGYRSFVLNPSGGSVGIGTTSPVSLLELSAAADSNPTFSLSDGDVAHGMTSLLPTNQILKIKDWSVTAGGAWLTGASDLGSVPAMTLQGVIGNSDPTDSIAAVSINGSKSNGGTGYQAMGSAETVFEVETGTVGSGTKLLSMLGNGNVGLGTTSPTAKLNIEQTNGSLALEIGQPGVGSIGSLRFYRNSLTNLTNGKIIAPTYNNVEYGSILYSPNNGLNNWTAGWVINETTSNRAITMASTFFDVTGTTSTSDVKMRIDGSGNVGIGTTSPTEKLSVTAGSSTALGLARSSAGQWASFADGTDTWGLYNYAGSPEGNVTANTGALSVDTNAGALYVKTDDGDATGWSSFSTGGASQWTDAGAYIYANNATSTVVDDNGNIGIGSITPGYALDVAGTVNISSGNSLKIAGTNVLKLSSTATGTWFFGNGGASHGANDTYNLSVGLGALTGLNNTGGTYNIAMGYNTLAANTTADKNIAIGYNALAATQTSGNNIVMGYNAALATTGTIDSIIIGNDVLQTGATQASVIIGNGAVYNNNWNGNGQVIVGYGAGRNIRYGGNNVMLGRDAGSSNNDGGSNTYVGYGSAYRFDNGSYNTFLGAGSGSGQGAVVSSSSNNTLIGYEAGYNIGNSASRNTALGVSAGRLITSNSSGNLFLGYAAGYNETGSDKLYIETGGTSLTSTNSLIYGNFSTDTLTFNANVGISTTAPLSKLSINGDLYTNTATISATYAGGKGLVVMGGPSGTANIIEAQNSSTTPLFTVGSGGALAIEGQLSDISNGTLEINDDLQVTGNDILSSSGQSAMTLTNTSVRVAGALASTGNFSSDGDTTLGSATNDDITFTGRAASSLIPKTSATYDLGSTTLRWNNVYAAASVSLPDTGLLRFGTNGDCTNDFCIDDSAIDTPYNYTITSHNTGNLYLMPDGNVGIGTTTTAQQLDVYEDGASKYAAKFFNDGNNANRWGVLVQAGLDDQTAAGPSTLMQFNDGNGDAIGSISFGSSLTAYNTTSDRRAKTNIAPTHMGIEDLMRIQIHNFSFAADPTAKIHTGFIAQELYDIFPDAVTPFTDGRYWQVDYGKVTPLIIKSVQDQQLRLAALDEKSLTLTADGYLATQQQAEVLGAVDELEQEVGGLSGLLTTIQTSVQSLVSDITWLKQAVASLQQLFALRDDKVNVTKDVIFSGREEHADGDRAGWVVVLAGKDTARVDFEKPYRQRPVVTATPEGLTEGYYLEEVSENGFTIHLKQSLGSDVTFNWTAILVTDARTTRQDGTGAAAAPANVPANSGASGGDGGQTSGTPTPESPTTGDTLTPASPSPSPVASPLSSPVASPLPSTSPEADSSPAPSPSTSPQP